MLDRDPLSIVVRLSEGDELGETMKKLRIWLDSETICPANFKTEADAAGYTFTFGFRTTQDAERFRARFGG
jgi:outer membrane lipoprotein-sorting protein